MKESDTSNSRGQVEPTQKSLTQFLNNIPESTKLRKYKKTAILCTAGSAAVEYRTYLTWEIALQVVRIVNREQLQHCIP
jgi:hypothetical protein